MYLQIFMSTNKVQRRGKEMVKCQFWCHAHTQTQIYKYHIQCPSTAIKQRQTFELNFCFGMSHNPIWWWCVSNNPLYKIYSARFLCETIVLFYLFKVIMLYYNHIAYRYSVASINEFLLWLWGPHEFMWMLPVVNKKHNNIWYQILGKETNE